MVVDLIYRVVLQQAWSTLVLTPPLNWLACAIFSDTKFKTKQNKTKKPQKTNKKTLNK